MDSIQPIKAIKAMMKRSNATTDRILSDPMWENSESGLSLWAAGTLVRKAEKQLAAYELGEKYGIDGPAMKTKVLLDADGNLVSRQLIQLYNKFSYGNEYKWLVAPEMRDVVGRKWIPSGPRSRIQKQLKLHEEIRITRAAGIDAACAGAGMPVSYFMVADDEAELIKP